MRNQSFVNVSNLLKSRGIKNHDFFLRLDDKGLEDVDPFDPNLTDDLKVRIINECSRNFWYFLREIVLIPTGKEPEKFQLNEANLAMMFCFLNNIDQYTNLPPQSGMTITPVTALNWAFNFHSFDTSFTMIIPPTIGTLNVAKMVDQISLLPDYIKIFMNEKTTSSSRTISNKRNNVINVKVMNERSEGKAIAFGRGLSPNVLIMDDFEYIPKVDKLCKAARPSTTVAIRQAKAKNKFGSRIMTSRVRDYHEKMDINTYQFIIDFISGCVTWDNKFYDMATEAIEKYIQKNSNNDTVYISFKGPDLFDKEYLERLKRSYLDDDASYEREVLMKRPNVIAEASLGEEGK